MPSHQLEPALEDEGYTILAGNTLDRPRMIRMTDEAGRLIDRLIVPGSRIIERPTGGQP